MKNLLMSLVAGFLSLLGFAAHAVGPDYTALTTGVDFTTLIAAVMAVAVLAVIYVLAKGGASAIVKFIGRMTS